MKKGLARDINWDVYSSIDADRLSPLVLVLYWHGLADEHLGQSMDLKASFLLDILIHFKDMAIFFGKNWL